MSNTQARPTNSRDPELFAAQIIPKIVAAVDDYSLLLSRGYAPKGASSLVGNRHQLNKRQQMMVSRAACSDGSLAKRKKTLLNISDLAGKTVNVDGYNILISIETALSNGPLFYGRDGCVRDIASVHGTYDKVEQTIPAVNIIIDFMDKLQINKANFYLDSPVKNSAKLKGIILEQATQYNCHVHVELVHNPDKTLVESDNPAITSDGWVLDNVRQWANFVRDLIEENETLKKHRIINLGF